MKNAYAIRFNIYMSSDEEKKELGAKIHKHLMENPDYVSGNIVLNIDQTCIINVDIYKECKNVYDIIHMISKFI